MFRHKDVRGPYVESMGTKVSIKYNEKKTDQQPDFHIWAKMYFVYMFSYLGAFYDQNGPNLRPGYPLTHINVHFK